MRVVRSSISTVASPDDKNAPQRSSLDDPATTASRYRVARSSESCAPSRASSFVAGIQNAPPERAVEPPTSSVFSMIRTSAPRSLAASAAARPVPEPTTSRSTVCSRSVMSRSSMD